MLEALLAIGGWIAGLITGVIVDRWGRKDQHKKEAIKDRRKELTDFSCQVLAAAYKACGNYVYKDEKEAAVELRNLMLKPIYGMDLDKVVAFQKDKILTEYPSLPMRLVEVDKDVGEFRRLEAMADFILEGPPRQAYESLKNAVLFDEFTTDQRDAYTAHVETMTKKFKETMQKATTDHALTEWYDAGH